MIKKRIKKIIKLGFLIAVRQIWKLLCNLYHLVYEPFLTLKTLIKDRDKSQIFLLALTAVSPAIIYATARYFWDHYLYGELVSSVGAVFAFIVLIELLAFFYIAFWIFKVFKKV